MGIIEDIEKSLSHTVSIVLHNDVLLSKAIDTIKELKDENSELRIRVEKLENALSPNASKMVTLDDLVSIIGGRREDISYTITSKRLTRKIKKYIQGAGGIPAKYSVDIIDMISEIRNTPTTEVSNDQKLLTYSEILKLTGIPHIKLLSTIHGKGVCQKIKTYIPKNGIQEGRYSKDILDVLQEYIPFRKNTKPIIEEGPRGAWRAVHQVDHGTLLPNKKRGDENGSA